MYVHLIHHRSCHCSIDLCCFVVCSAYRSDHAPNSRTRAHPILTGSIASRSIGTLSICQRRRLHLSHFCSRSSRRHLCFCSDHHDTGHHCMGTIAIVIDRHANTILGLFRCSAVPSCRCCQHEHRLFVGFILASTTDAYTCARALVVIVIHHRHTIRLSGASSSKQH